MTADLRIRLIPSDNLGMWITAFLDDLALANRSPGTIRFYRGNLERFHWWCREFNAPLDPEALTSNDLRQFLLYVQSTSIRWDRPDVHMASRAATPNLLHVYFRSLRPFFNWLVDQEVIDRSPMTKLKPPRLRAEQPDPFTEDDLRRIGNALRSVGDNEMAERNRAIVAVLLDIGLRASELGSIHVDDVDFATGDVLVRSGKGDKARQLRVGARARRSLRRYWIRYRRADGPTGPLFLTATGRAMTQNTLKQMLERVGKRAGVHPINPHRFRHTSAVSAIRAGMNLFQVQYMLGHTDLAMTRRYVKLVDSDMALAAEEHSALDYLNVKL